MIESFNTDKDNWDLVLTSMKELTNIDSELGYSTSRSISSKIVISSVFKSMSLYQEAFKLNQEAELLLEDYEKGKNTDKLKEFDLEQSFILELKSNEIPFEILRQEILLQRGELLQSTHNLKEACILFTKCLEFGKIYKPEIRKKCLENLKIILESQQLLAKAPNINRLLEMNFDKKNNDIVFLLDSSESMGGASSRKDYAIREILKFFDNYMDSNDRIALIRFNQNCHIIFGLQDRGKNKLFLRNSIQNSGSLFNCSGGTAFYSAIFEGLELFKQTENKNNNKWIIALTDGEDNCSKVKYNEIYDKLKKSDVNLLIIGLALDEECIENLIKLCKVTEKGIFVKSAADSINIEIAFQMMQKIALKNYNEENVETLI